MSDRIRVLCVDDHEDAARTTAMLLNHAGFDAKACHDGIEALAVAEQFRPDVCVIDLSMPGMNGDELAGKLRERAGANPPRCIALTGSWDIASQHKTHNAGFEQHLVKPVEPDRLIEAIKARPAAG